MPDPEPARDLAAEHNRLFDAVRAIDQPEELLRAPALMSPSESPCRTAAARSGSHEPCSVVEPPRPSPSSCRRDATKRS
jgi:hypothetical protein